MQFSEHIEQGVVLLDEALDLPDGTPVVVATVDQTSSRELHQHIQRLAGRIPTGIGVERLLLESVIEKHS